MAGRNHLREFPLQSRPHLPAVMILEKSVPRRAPPHHSLSVPEDRIATLQREFQVLLLENQRLAATHVALKQELSLAHQDLRHLAAAAPKIKADRDAEVRKVLENSVKVEARFRTVESLVTELAVVRGDIDKLKLEKEELGAQLKAVNGDLERAKLEVRELPEIKAEMESLAQDLQKGRAAVDTEIKNRTTNLEHGRVMERIMLSMSCEIDNLRAELANAEKRAREAAAAGAVAANPGPGYATMYANTNVVYGGGLYPVQYPVHQGRDVSDAMPHYGQAPAVSGPCNNTSQENGQI